MARLARPGSSHTNVALLIMRFSERKGITPVRTELQASGIDDKLRNRLWNVLCECWPSYAPKSPYIHGPYETEQALFRTLWHDFFKAPLDTMDTYTNAIVDEFRKFFFKCEWYSVYDFTEFVACALEADGRDPREFTSRCNQVLKEEMSAFRFVGNLIAPLTSEEEVTEIRQAAALPDPFNCVAKHIDQSLSLLANRTRPDYRNSIKEAISAVEAICSLVAGIPKADLSRALDALQTRGNVKLHPAMRLAFEKLYAYTSDEDGVRHALMEESTLGQDDAKFMLIACSAFVNFLVAKVEEAGLTLGRK